MKLRAFAIFAIATLLPSSVAAQDNLVCVKLGSSSTSSLQPIAEEIIEILTERLREEWLCDSHPAEFWLQFGVSLFANSEDRETFDAYLSFYGWVPGRRRPFARSPVVIGRQEGQESAQEVAETFRNWIVDQHTRLGDRWAEQRR